MSEERGERVRDEPGLLPPAVFQDERGLPRAASLADVLDVVQQVLVEVRAMRTEWEMDRDTYD